MYLHALRYIFYFLLETCISNTYVLHKNFTPSGQKKWNGYKYFRIELAENLIASYHNRKRYSLPTEIYTTALDFSTTPTKRRKFGDVPHYPVRGQKKGRCAYCWYQNFIRHETIVMCRQCSVHLCVIPRETDDNRSCFELYHSS